MPRRSCVSRRGGPRARRPRFTWNTPGSLVGRHTPPTPRPPRSRARPRLAGLLPLQVVRPRSLPCPGASWHRGASRCYAPTAAIGGLSRGVARRTTAQSADCRVNGRGAIRGEHSTGAERARRCRPRPSRSSHGSPRDGLPIPAKPTRGRVACRPPAAGPVREAFVPELPSALYSPRRCRLSVALLHIGVPFQPRY